MSHDHDHAAMVANSTSMIDHEHLTEQNTFSSGQGLHMMMMAMTFHGGYREKILFDQWETHTVGAFIGSWILVLFLGAFYEGLKTLRDILAQRALCDTCSPSQNRSQGLTHSDDNQYERTSDNDLMPTVKTENRQIKCFHFSARLLSLPHMIQTLLHIIQMTLSYFLMLIAMTFNTYLFLAVVFGAGLGHFLFAWRRSSVLDHNEHCH